MNEHENSFTVTLLLIRYQVSLGDVSTGAVESGLSSEEDELLRTHPISQRWVPTDWSLPTRVSTTARMLHAYWKLG